jgi:inhibitor of cysteine peptidase
MTALTLADNGARVNVRVGELIALQLDENPTTGFRWVLLPTMGATVESDRMSDTGGTPGAGGQRLLSLRVLQQGKHQLQLRCERPWEGAATAITTFKLTLLAA